MHFSHNGRHLKEMSIILKNALKRIGLNKNLRFYYSLHGNKKGKGNKKGRLMNFCSPRQEPNFPELVFGEKG